MAIVATGKNFPDALAGAALSGSNGSVLVLADSSTHPTVSFLYDNRSALMEGYFLGGEAVVSANLANEVAVGTDAELTQ